MMFARCFIFVSLVVLFRWVYSTIVLITCKVLLYFYFAISTFVLIFKRKKFEKKPPFRAAVSVLCCFQVRQGVKKPASCGRVERAGYT
nr:MAG TPA: hypothetical protein [Caudoviricetes sp.]